jgi:group I intron endonuclease
MGFVYKITNKTTNKCYIGITRKDKVEKRWNQHMSDISRGCGCPALQCAVLKYGKENFVFEVILVCQNEDLIENEIRLIKEYNSMVPNGYNITPGGEGGSFTSRLHTEETKNKIRESISKISNGYFSNPKNISKQRENMAKAVGKKVYQYDENNNFVKEFISCSEAARQTGVCKNTIQNGLKTPNQLRRGFYWRNLLV